MKIAIQIGLLPGNTLEEKFYKAKEIGFEGIEVYGRDLLNDEKIVEKYKNLSKEMGIQISSICAGYRKFLLDPTHEERQQSRNEIKKLLEFGNYLGVVGLILVPVFGSPKITDLSPYKNAFELEKELLISQLPELVEKAEKEKCALLLEPLNRYETHFMNRIEQGIELCKRIKSEYLKTMADFFHMSIEEVDIARAIKKGGKLISHVHLADSNRILPGMGHTDFKKGFKALKKIGYDKFLALECGVPEPKKENLDRCFHYLKNIIETI
ncbi:MAG TPA: sugar phosphate isomerase/epimerase family protein [bacterium]|nr:sugar phosphate isomerase/epimerase family protein [bacterium]